MKPSRDVWNFNVEQELTNISMLASSPFASYISIDTEFPGFLHRTPLGSSEHQCYTDMKLNVDSMKLIQLGLTFYSQQGKKAFSWQVNFRDFDPTVDRHAEASIQLLKKSGISFDRNQRDGVDAVSFSQLFLEKLVLRCREKTKWLTFHGLYDLGYIVKLLTGSPLPKTLPEFLFLVQKLLGDVYDVKYIARFCGFGEKIGLVKMAEELDVKLGGQKHQAGYDSMVTGLVLWKLKEVFGVDEDEFVGILHGAEETGLANFSRREYMRALMAKSGDLEQSGFDYSSYSSDCSSHSIALL